MESYNQLFEMNEWYNQIEYQTNSISKVSGQH